MRKFKVLATYPGSPLTVGLILEELAVSRFKYVKNGVEWITYIVKIENYKHLFEEVMYNEEETDERMKSIGQNGNTGEHYAGNMLNISNDCSDEELEIFASKFDFSIKEHRIEYLRTISNICSKAIEHELQVSDVKSRINDYNVIFGKDRNEDDDSFYDTIFGTEVTYEHAHNEPLLGSEYDSNINYGTTGSHHPLNENVFWKIDLIHKIYKNWEKVELITINSTRLKKILTNWVNTK